MEDLDFSVFFLNRINSIWFETLSIKLPYQY